MATAPAKTRITYQDFLHTGPGTLAGRYLRTFWQPVYIADDLPPGRAVPVRIMSEDFTLYRGEDGTPHLVDFCCAHRGTQLSVGWVEGDCIRCFCHGWKYNGSGQCVEQPAEPEPFAQKVRIPSYPVQEYIGLIFAYLGEGEPPPLPRYPNFEDPESVLDVEAYPRPCNYFHNVENSVDTSHVAFVHRAHRDYAQDWTAAGNPTMVFEESSWGITNHARYGNGVETTTHFGMPNINYVYGQVVDEDVKRLEMLLFKVPVDDESHTHFRVLRIRTKGDFAEKARQIAERGRARRKRDVPQTVEIANAILAGKMRLDDLDPNRIDFVQIEDTLAQAGQGVMWDAKSEHLGRADAGIILLRKLWRRDLQALAEGRPRRRWTFQPDMAPEYPNA